MCTKWSKWMQQQLNKQPKFGEYMTFFKRHSKMFTQNIYWHLFIFCLPRRCAERAIWLHHYQRFNKFFASRLLQISELDIVFISYQKGSTDFLFKLFISFSFLIWTPFGLRYRKSYGQMTPFFPCFFALISFKIYLIRQTYISKLRKLINQENSVLLNG